MRQQNPISSRSCAVKYAHLMMAEEEEATVLTRFLSTEL